MVIVLLMRCHLLQYMTNIVLKLEISPGSKTKLFCFILVVLLFELFLKLGWWKEKRIYTSNLLKFASF